MSNRLYDMLKKIALVVLPATATFVFSLSSLFGWEWGEIPVGVITAVDTFLGALLGISTAQYNKVNKNEDK